MCENSLFVGRDVLYGIIYVYDIQKNVYIWTILYYGQIETTFRIIKVTRHIYNYILTQNSTNLSLCIK